MKIFLRIIFLILCINFLSISFANQENTLIGILENHEKEEGEDFYKDKKYVRVAFKKNKNEWLPYIKLEKKLNKYNLKEFHLFYPHEINWNIFYKGRIRGNISSIRIPYPFSGKEFIDKYDILVNKYIGLQKIKDKDRIYKNNYIGAAAKVLIDMKKL